MCQVNSHSQRIIRFWYSLQLFRESSCFHLSCSCKSVYIMFTVSLLFFIVISSFLFFYMYGCPRDPKFFTDIQYCRVSSTFSVRISFCPDRLAYAGFFACLYDVHTSQKIYYQFPKKSIFFHIYFQNLIINCLPTLDNSLPIFCL